MVRKALQWSLGRTVRRLLGGGRPVGIEPLEPRAMLASLSGTVQQTLDAVGLDPNDPDAFAAVANVTVVLDDGTRQVTDSSGAYTFAGVAPGRRQVTVLPPAGFFGATAQSLSFAVTVGADDVTGLNFGLTSRNDAIIQNLYQLVLQRSPTAEELSAGASRLQAGQTVAAEFGRLLKSSEFGQNVLPVAGFVRATLPGVLDIGSVRASGQQQNIGIAADATVEGIMASQKFVAVNGDTSTLTDAAYVQFLYRRVLNRAATTAQVNAGVAKLGGGTSRGQFALDLVGTQAFQGRSQLQRSLRGAITYVGVLGRQATAAEIQSFTAAKTTAVQLAGRLSSSAEFRGLDGFTSTAYWDVMASLLAPPVQPLSRLQRFNPATEAFDLPVTAGSITSTSAAPRNVYFVAHGWAPGQSEAVLLGSTPGDPLKSWAATPPVPAWLFDPTAKVSTVGLAQAIVHADPQAIVVAYSWLDLSATPMDLQPTQVTLTASGASGEKTLDVGDVSQLSAGMQVSGPGIPDGTSILAIASPTQVALSQALSATITSASVTFTGLNLNGLLQSILYVGQSESRTQWAGQMLAAAIDEALAPDFYGANQGLVHLMGHSHGAKVATVAAVTLEAADRPVSQLTLFDSPEMGPLVKMSPTAAPVDLGVAGLGGGQNFSWRFLQELPEISRTPVAADRQATGGTFVENYYSRSGFGSAVGGHTGLGEVVDVSLRPGTLYNPAGTLGGALAAALPSHQYPAAWYAQASLQHPGGPPNTQNGLTWSPLIRPEAASALADSYDQYPQSGSATPAEFLVHQFELFGGGPTPSELIVDEPFQYSLQSTVGNVADTGTMLTLGVGGGTSLSMATVGFVPLADADSQPVGTGLELDVQFSGVDPGETVQLVVSVHGIAAPRLLGGLVTLGGTTGLMTIPLLALDGLTAGAARTMATVSLDGFNPNEMIMGPFSNPANSVPTLVFSLIASPGSAASVTVSGMKQFGTPTSGPI
jgi:hypothetical protein